MIRKSRNYSSRKFLLLFPVQHNIWKTNSGCSGANQDLVDIDILPHGIQTKVTTVAQGIKWECLLYVLLLLLPGNSFGI